MSETRRLVEEARAGIVEAREFLYARHLGRLRAFVGARLSAQARRITAADDVVQEVYLHSMAKLDAFEYRGDASL